MRTAVIITGMLRNYNAALLSLHIWGDTTNVDRYLITWKSAGPLTIDDYCAKAHIYNKLIVDDSVVETLPQCLRHYTWMRLTYLWQVAANWVPSRYDRYIFIRPDGFHWIFDFSVLRQCVYDYSGLRFQGINVVRGTINDQLIISDLCCLEVLRSCYSSVIPIALRYYNRGDIINCHKILFDLFNRHVNVTATNAVGDIDVILVRDNFEVKDFDKYDYNFYLAVFYDSGAWWRRTYGVNYERRPKMPPT